MQIFKFKWIMQRHFRHLHFNTFPMVSWGPIWCLFVFSSKVLNIRDSYMNATLKVRMHLRVIRFFFLHISHLWEWISLSNTFSWPHIPLHSTFNHKLNVKVVILLICKTCKNPSPKHTIEYTQQYAQTKFALKKNLQQ